MKKLNELGNEALGNYVGEVYLYTLKNGEVVERKGALYHRDPVFDDGQWCPGDSYTVTYGKDAGNDFIFTRCAFGEGVYVNGNIWFKNPDIKNAKIIFRFVQRERARRTASYGVGNGAMHVKQVKPKISRV